jgi:predicted DNA binding CopG/RHH family protein
MTNYIIPINKGKRKKKGEKGKQLFLYDSAINIRIISYLLTKKEKKGKEREKSFLFCLYDSAINIRIISYLLTKKKKRKGRKGKNLFCFVCMILLLIYMCLCLVIKMNCMYT